MKSFAEGFAGVLEIGSAGADLGAREAHGARGDEGISAFEMEADPAESGANSAGTVGGDLKGISAAEIDGDGGRRGHNKLSSRSPDGGMDGANIELEALVIVVGLQKTNAGIGIDFNFAEVVIGKESTGSGIGGESLADVEFG